MVHARQLSRHAAERYLLDLQGALQAVHQGIDPEMNALAWPAGLDRSVLNGLRLEVRTRNCLASAQLLEGDDPLTVQQLLSMHNFGRKSLRDLLFAVEKFLKECVRIGAMDVGHPSSPEWTSQNAPRQRSFPTMAGTPDTSWERVGKLIRPLLAAAAELHGVATLADLLAPECNRLASKMGIAADIEAIGVDDVIDGTPGPASVVSTRLALTLDTLSPRQRTIIEHRILCTPPKTLEEVGAELGVTRERIRQIQIKLEGRIRFALGSELRLIASVLKERFGHMALESNVDRCIGALKSTSSPLVNRLFRYALITDMGYTLDNGVYFDERALAIVEEIGASARRLADDVGLVDEEQLVAELPSEDWHRFWPWLRERCRLHHLHGSLALRDSGKAQAKAALISLGRPATREEIARMCGFSESKVGSHLSVIPSVVKADKDRWGLDEWIDDEYDGIVGEIIQRIDEDGGATTTERLLRELPGKFNVNPVSVRAYMQTPRFEIRDGWISLASASSLRLRHLDDVIDGRDNDGAPYWTFSVEGRFFDGYSVTGVPPEFAKALGCRPDGNRSVRIANLPDCRDLSIRWPLASTTGASLGYLAEPLQRLELQPGQRARVTIRGPGLASLTAEDGRLEPPPESGADAILSRIKSRRRAL